MDTFNHKIDMLFPSRIADILYDIEPNISNRYLTGICRALNSVQNSIIMYLNENRERNWRYALYDSISADPYFEFCCGCICRVIKALLGRHGPPPWKGQNRTKPNNLLKKTDSEGDLCCLAKGGAYDKH